MLHFGKGQDPSNSAFQKLHYSLLLTFSVLKEKQNVPTTSTSSRSQCKWQLLLEWRSLRMWYQAGGQQSSRNWSPSIKQTLRSSDRADSGWAGEPRLASSITAINCLNDLYVHSSTGPHSLETCNDLQPLSVHSRTRMALSCSFPGCA